MELNDSSNVKQKHKGRYGTANWLLTHFVVIIVFVWNNFRYVIIVQRPLYIIHLFEVVGRARVLEKGEDKGCWCWGGGRRSRQHWHTDKWNNSTQARRHTNEAVLSLHARGQTTDDWWQLIRGNIWFAGGDGVWGGSDLLALLPRLFPN